MNIGIIGAGHIGGTLARKLASLGHAVSVANSRGPASLSHFAKATGAKAVSIADVAKGAGLVIVSIPEKSIAQLPAGLFREVPEETIVVDTGNYYPMRDGRIDAIEEGMTESAWVSRQLGRPVVKAFNTIMSNSLSEGGLPAGTAGRIALPVAGDRKRDKAAVIGLIDKLGFDGVDAGSLDHSWRQEPGTPVYCTDLDAAGVRRALPQADRTRSAKLRDLYIAEMLKLPAGSTPRDRVLLARSLQAS